MLQEGLLTLVTWMKIQRDILYKALRISPI